jgi:hypothetical protein
MVWFQAILGKLVMDRPYLKNKTKRKRTGDVFQVVEHIPSKGEALSSIPSATKKERTNSVPTKSMIYHSNS